MTRRASHATLLLALSLLLPASARGANPCENGGSAALVSPGGGIGGTGFSGDTGIGGTGRAGEGIGGTGRAPGDGIGGTGRSSQGPGDSGIGGTGRARALFGTVTGYASLCVAGLEVDYDASSLAGAAPPAIGETVEILATGDGERLRATSIERRPALVGIIDRLDADARTMDVLGQRVVYDDSTRTRLEGGTDAPTASAALHAGMRVRVSGLARLDGSIVASRVDADAQGEDETSLLSGRVAASDDGNVRVGSAVVDVSKLGDRSPQAGEQVALSVRRDGATLQAVDVHRPFGGLASVAERQLDIETFVGKDGRTVAIGGQRLVAPTTTGGGARVRVSAQVAPGGRIGIERVRPLGGWIPPERMRGDMSPGARAPKPMGGPPPRPDGRPQRPDRIERPLFPDRPPPHPPPRPPRM